MLVPNQQRALELLDSVVFLIGHTQHYFEPRAMHDRIRKAYREVDSPDHIPTPWNIHMLLILAFGKLIQGDVREGESHPGILLYRQAVSRLPDIGVLYSWGITAVEITGMCAMYLQNIDCREEAYLYVSLILAKT